MPLSFLNRCCIGWLSSLHEGSLFRLYVQIGGGSLSICVAFPQAVVPTLPPFYRRVRRHECSRIRPCPPVHPIKFIDCVDEGVNRRK